MRSSQVGLPTSWAYGICARRGFASRFPGWSLGDVSEVPSRGRSLERDRVLVLTTEPVVAAQRITTWALDHKLESDTSRSPGDQGPIAEAGAMIRGALAGLLGGALPACRLLIRSTFGRPGYLRRATEGGAAGFLLEDAPAHELAMAIRRAVAGERVADPGLAAAALSHVRSPLSAGEREVLSASRAHATVAQLAGALYLSPETVRNHLSAAMEARRP